jgi:hypothetical protein
MLTVNNIKPNSKTAKTYAYAFMQGIITAGNMYEDVLHPALYIALLRNDINELNYEQKK